MKKNVIIVVCVILTFIFKGVETGSMETVLNTKETSYVNMRFQLENAEVKNEEYVKQLCSMLDDLELKEYGVQDEMQGKGWIYEITTYSLNKDKLQTIYIISDNMISVDGDLYECSTVNLELLDDISGIDRYK